MKRMIDVITSLIGLILLSPLLLLVMILIWIHDFHSPFYIAPRVGKSGQVFNMVKLRSMVVHADKTGVDSTSSSDPRITPIGHIVRKFKLDDIFTIDDVSGLKTIEDMINKRVTQEWVMVMNDNGDPTAEKMLSPEYQKLQEHGVQISEVRIHNVMIDPKKEKQIIERWKVEWMAVAEQEDKFLSEKERLIETTAREYASRNFAKIASSKFDTASKKNEDRYETLMKLIEPFKEAILDNSLSSEETEAQLKKLEEIWKWLLVNHYERESRMKQGKDG